MSENENESKKYKYLVTMRWYVETDEDLVAGASDTDKKLLDLVQHRSNGKPVCESCPTRHYEGYGVLDYHHFMGDKKKVYMSTEKVKAYVESEEKKD